MCILFKQLNLGAPIMQEDFYRQLPQLVFAFWQYLWEETICNTQKFSIHNENLTVDKNTCKTSVLAKKKKQSIWYWIYLYIKNN